ncbi:MAG: hypothetical protein KDK90_01130 [Leptospiraceae bacterium]|nr:hypothetical protein [Leptospiraceae bacterium]
MLTQIPPLPPPVPSTINYREEENDKEHTKIYTDNYFLFTNEYINKIQLNEENDFKDQKIIEYKEKLNNIKKIDFDSEGLEPPSEKIFIEANGLIEKLVEKDFFMSRISESVEGGLCFYFNHGTKILYFEVYNDGEKGYIVEDTFNKKILNNRDISSYEELFIELENFFL